MTTPPSRILGLLLLIAVPLMGWGQRGQVGTARGRDVDRAKKDPSGCQIHRVTDLPGSHGFASDFIEAIANDPDPGAGDAGVVSALTADLSSAVPAKDRALYVSWSTDGGETWREVARMGPRYFDAAIGEGLRNGLSVAPGGREFVITTQEGAFQVFPAARGRDAVVKPIPGPRVPDARSTVTITKQPGDPVRAGVVLMTADGKRMIVGYGYFDDDPQLISYRRDGRGGWIEDGMLPRPPTDLDIFSMQWDDAKKRRPDALYVGMGDQAYRLDFGAEKWTRIAGVGPDSAIHSMSMVGGPHLAACWGVYEPVNAVTVARVTNARFLLHRWQDEVGPNIRAYAIAVDPARPSREVLAAITGVYTSRDGGQSWKRLNDLPEGEFHTAYFNRDGTVIVSGFAGTFVVNPFSSACGPRLMKRVK